MKKIDKKILIPTLIISFLILSLILIFIYQYKTGFSYKILNDSQKLSENTPPEETETNEGESSDTQDISEEEIQEDITEEEIEDIPSSTPTSTPNWWEYPNEILETTKNGDDLLVIVTKKYKLPSTYIPSGLVNASGSGIRRGDSYLLRSMI